jgi:hypothetical protein
VLAAFGNLIDIMVGRFRTCEIIGPAYNPRAVIERKE